MASTSSTRIWRVHQAAKLPFPTLSADPVMQYLIMEAVAMKIAHEDKEAQKAAEREQWKKDRGSLADELR